MGASGSACELCIGLPSQSMQLGIILVNIRLGHTRVVAHRLLPSTRQERILARSSRLTRLIVKSKIKVDNTFVMVDNNTH